MIVVKKVVLIFLMTLSVGCVVIIGSYTSLLWNDCSLPNLIWIPENSAVSEDCSSTPLRIGRGFVIIAIIVGYILKKI